MNGEADSILVKVDTFTQITQIFPFPPKVSHIYKSTYVEFDLTKEDEDVWVENEKKSKQTTQKKDVGLLALEIVFLVIKLFLIFILIQAGVQIQNKKESIRFFLFAPLFWFSVVDLGMFFYLLLGSYTVSLLEIGYILLTNIPAVFVYAIIVLFLVIKRKKKE